MKKIIAIVVLLLILIAGGYWYFFMRTGTGQNAGDTGTPSSGFSPFGRTPTGSSSSGNDNTTPSNTDTTTTQAPKIPILRMLSASPVGGYGASTTMIRVIEPIPQVEVGTTSTSTSTNTKKPKTPVATSTVKMVPVTIVRWVDRGRGNISEARSDSLDIATLSNTIVPKVIESVWSKDLSSFIGTLFVDGTTETSGVYASLKPRIVPKTATTTATTTNQSSSTPFELSGKNLPDGLLTYASSPKKDKLFMLVKEGTGSAGYVSTFDGKSVTRIFGTPLTQVSVEWPEANTIAITTKGTATEGGYLYFVDPKTGYWKKILGPVAGMSTKVSTDAKRVIVSTTGKNKNVLTSIYTVSSGKGMDAIVRTLADKCAWGNFYKDLVYCAAPSQTPEGTYPDDWYLGTVSFADKVWQMNATTGEVKLISSIVDMSDRVIDIFNPIIDDKDEFLYFMNKNDLSLWSLDLTRGN